MFNIFSFLNTTTYSFEGKKEGEEVVIFLHRHWFTLFSKVVFIFLAALIPFIVLAFLGKALIAYTLINFFACLWAAYYLFLWYFLFYSLTMYTLDTWMVTNMRIINSVQHGFFNRNISELAIDKVQDVSLVVEGAIPTVLKFGDLKVQTAGSDRHFIFEDTPDPQKIKDKIMELVAIKKHELESEIESQMLAKL